MQTPRPIDHAVLPTADLETARARLTALGFTVAPDGRHPFGTANACVYLADGTFIEPLAVLDRDAAHDAAQAGNAFVGHDRVYRTRIGEEGFSALVFGTDDATADHARFTKLGISAGAPLEFSRPFTGKDGSSDIASFHLAFAGDLRSTDALFFTCQRVNQPAVDRGALQTHQNGVLGISRIVLSAPEPEHFQMLLEYIAGGKGAMHEHGFDLVAGDTTLSVLADTGMADWLGVETPRSDRSLHLAGIEFRVGDLDAAASALAASSVAFTKAGGRLVVHPAPGQGATFEFAGPSP